MNRWPRCVLNVERFVESLYAFLFFFKSDHISVVVIVLMLDVFGQIGSLEDHYHFHHSRVVRRAAFSLKGPHSFIHMDPEVRLTSVSFKWNQNVQLRGYGYTNTLFPLV